MSANNTLMVKDLNGKTYFINGNGNSPNSWWGIVFIIAIIIFELIKLKISK